MPQPLPDPGEIPTRNRTERFLIGFIVGAISGFLGMLRDGHFLPALIPGLLSGLLIGGISALFGKRVFDFLIALLARFP